MSPMASTTGAPLITTSAPAPVPPAQQCQPGASSLPGGAANCCCGRPSSEGDCKSWGSLNPPCCTSDCSLAICQKFCPATPAPPTPAPPPVMPGACNATGTGLDAAGNATGAANCCIGKAFPPNVTSFCSHWRPADVPCCQIAADALLPICQKYCPAPPPSACVAMVDATVTAGSTLTVFAVVLSVLMLSSTAWFHSRAVFFSAQHGGSAQGAASRQSQRAWLVPAFYSFTQLQSALFVVAAILLLAPEMPALVVAASVAQGQSVGPCPLPVPIATAY